MNELSRLLELMIDEKASDLIFTYGAPPQFRISGMIQPVPDKNILRDKDIDNVIASLLSEEQVKRFRSEKELDTSFDVEGLSRFRLNAYYQRGSAGIAIRNIPYDIPRIDDLNLPPIVKEFAEMPNGLILVTGPTGSGKSTTLASMIEYINQKYQYHIITVEDPIEFIHSHKRSIIDQREVGSDTLSFHEALRRILRETPDVIMIGEMRDLDTIRSALTIAETGHLVFATLHTHSASHAISRIIDVFPSTQQQQIKVQLSEVLVGVVVQALLPRASGSGRILATEVMNVTAAIKNLIRTNNIHQIYSAIQTGIEHGMHTLNNSLFDLVRLGLVDKGLALQRSNNSKELLALLKQHGR